MPDFWTIVLCVAVLAPAVYISWKADEWRRRAATAGERRGIEWAARRRRPLTPKAITVTDSPHRLPAHISPKPPHRNGMTTTALFLLIALLAVPGWQIYRGVDAWIPPQGEEKHEAVVETIGAPDRHRPGSRPGTDWLVITFTDPEGEPGWAMYENRWFGDVSEGDEVVIYREEDLRTDEGQWRTMSESSPAGVLGGVGGVAALLLMMYGWVKVRRRATSDVA